MTTQRSGLQWGIQNVSLAGGLETKTHPKLVESPKTTTAENVIYTTNGAVRKRNGFTSLSMAISGGGTISNATSGAVVGSELVLVDSTSNLYAYSPAAARWQRKGGDVLDGVTATPMYTTPALTATPLGTTSYADIGNYRVVAFDSVATDPATVAVSGTKIFIGLWDVQKKAWITAPAIATLSTNGTCGPSVVAFGAYFYVFCQTNVAGNASYQYFLLNSATFAASGLVLPAPTLVATVAAVPGVTTTVDAAVNPAGSVMYAYGSGGVATGTVYKFTTPGSNFSASTNLVNMGGRATIAVNTSYVLITGTTQAEVLDTATLTEGAAIAHGLTGGQTFVGALSTTGATQYAMIAGNALVTAGAAANGYMLATVTAPRTLVIGTATRYPRTATACRQWPVSKPAWIIEAGGNASFRMWSVAIGQLSTTLQATLYVDRFVPGATATVYARAAYDVASIPSTTLPNTTLPAPPSSTALTTLALAQSTLTAYALTSETTKMVVPLARGAFITGSRPMYYDGTTVGPAGFDSYPELPAAPAATAVGPLSANTQYFYCMANRSYDSYGNILYSSPGPVQSVTTGAAEFGVTITPPAGTGWTQGVLYRTTATDFLNFREVGGVPIGAAVYTEATSDATLAANGKAFLYANPVNGEVANDPAPACEIAVATQNRIFLISSEDPALVYYSKPFRTGRGPEFSALQYLPIDSATGPCTALAVMDGNLVIFKERSIYVLTGEGPDATGNGVFNPVVRVAADNGTSFPGSVVSTADGVYFQSGQGIDLLNRALETEYVGAPVEGVLTTRGDVTTAVHVPYASQIRFYLGDGSAVVFDTFLKRWSTFSGQSEVVAGGVLAPDPGASRGVAWVLASGVVSAENFDFTDDGVAITMTLETGWIPVSENPQGWGRLRRVLALGTFKSSHIATLSFAYDWNDTYVDAVQFSSAVSGDTVEQWRTRTKRQVMQSVRLKLVDSAITGESYDIVGLALETATKAGTAKLPQAKSV